MLVEPDLRATDTFVHDSLEAILHSAIQAVGASCGTIALVKTKDDITHRGLPCGLLPTLESRATVARWVAARGKPLEFESREQALRITGLAIGPEEPLPLICVPIRSEGQTVGTLQVNIPSLADDKEPCQKLPALELAATSMGYLLENDKLRQELREKEIYMRRLVKATIDGQEVERERIYLEVHDGVSQTLASAFQYLQALENTLSSQETQAKHMVSRTIALVRQAIQETREIINSITPATLGDLGLVRTLHQELKQFEKETGCKIEFKSDWPKLAQDVEIALYRIIHEAVTNVRKHANSQKLRIELSCLPDHLVALITDWGGGFDPGQQEPVPSRHSAGLFSMRRRAELLGGRCEVRSAPGQGTEIKVEVPTIE